jgi:hypothetical protein
LKWLSSGKQYLNTHKIVAGETAVPDETGFQRQLHHIRKERDRLSRRKMKMN